jgi:hypothetical protein
MGNDMENETPATVGIEDMTCQNDGPMLRGAVEARDSRGIALRIDFSGI